MSCGPKTRETYLKRASNYQKGDIPNLVAIPALPFLTHIASTAFAAAHSLYQSEVSELSSNSDPMTMAQRLSDVVRFHGIVTVAEGSMEGPNICCSPSAGMPSTIYRHVMCGAPLPAPKHDTFGRL